jgi:hypothetical protein
VFSVRSVFRVSRVSRVSRVFWMCWVFQTTARSSKAIPWKPRQVGKQRPAIPRRIPKTSRNLGSSPSVKVLRRNHPVTQPAISEPFGQGQRHRKRSSHDAERLRHPATSTPGSAGA